ncbi:methyltransferase type 11 [Bacillus methanolicus PB1]|uniref:Methyltransferase type 11 n=1 Tax=Bacillus methanolicus PB1 TaxID=997296 RepID=I3E204_BACMT|nr:class I SAM-dependent methyltransferase [Bacillus methanolicus]EIJ80525.1 methyltransferase type 11 [Bacillus methanolicus PB1]
MNNSLKEQWEKSYKNKDNFVFYPNEEVIRFTSKYIRKRVGLNEFIDVHNYSGNPKVLDLGCGIGRHLIYGLDMNLDMYGIDLSEVAINFARKWAKQNKMVDVDEKIVQGDICNLPWKDHFFNYVITHGVLDSIRFENAKLAVQEVARVLIKGGLFYCDLISGDHSSKYREYCGEEIVTTEHEQGTVQSYFNFSKIEKLFLAFFEIVECKQIKHENCLAQGYHSRYHIVLKRK